MRIPLMLTLYGSPHSRASRCIWMLEELAVDYNLVPVGNPKSQEYLAINPNGKVPCLQDGDVAVWESMAINLYLASTRDSPLAPKNNRELADVLKWTLWAQGELEGYFNLVASLDEVSPEWMRQTFGVIEATLANSDYLLGDRFTVADLNVCAMFMGPVSSIVELDAFPATAAWRKGSYRRAAAKATVDQMLAR